MPTLATVKVIVILGCCALIIITLTYYGYGAWLRDKARTAERRRNSSGGA
jgi:hypothetical protein